MGVVADAAGLPGPAPASAAYLAALDSLVAILELALVAVAWLRSPVQEHRYPAVYVYKLDDADSGDEASPSDDDDGDDDGSDGYASGDARGHEDDNIV